VVAPQDGTIATIEATAGSTVDAGQTVLSLDVSNLQSQLTVLQQEQDQNTADLANYQKLRQAALAGNNPFDAVKQASFYYLLVQYRQNLAQAYSSTAQASVTADFMLSATTAEQQLQAQQDALALQIIDLQHGIGQATITAPVAGVYEASFAWQAGDQVQAGQSLFQIIPPSDTRIDALVPPNIVTAIAVGQSIPCTVPNDPAGHPADLTCQVEYVPASSDTTQNGQADYTVRLSVVPGSDLAGYGTGLPVGLPVSLTIPVDQLSALRWLGEKVGLAG